MSFFTKERRRKAGLIISFLAGLAVAAFVWAYFIEPSRLVITRADVYVKNWNRAFEGMRIVMIADIHGGSNNVDEAKIDRVVEAANAEKADLIVLLGDYVSQQYWDRSKLKMPVSTIAEHLKPLKARYGVYAVLGNHDVWNDAPKITAALRSAGINVLQHQVATIDIGGADLRLLGLRDHTLVDKWNIYSKEARAVVDSSKGTGDIIVLSHSPDMIRLITGKYKVSDHIKLFLAGHTHGGQVWLPLIGSPIVPSSYGQKYARGHITEEGVEMYVTTGIGTSILPIRFLVPPEITVLTVKGKDSQSRTGK